MKRVLSVLLCLLVLLAVCAGTQTTAATEKAQTSQSIDTPRVEIVTDSGEGLKLQKEDGYIGATVTVTDTNGKQVGGTAQVKIRGNSTSRLNKKSYTFKFSQKTDVLGMGKAKKWAVVANMFDPTLLRNHIAFDGADVLGLEYTSCHQIVEVWMDGSFRGCYLLAETVQEGKTRVDIDIESNGGKKDFLIEREMNHIDEGAVYFRTNGIRFVCSDPDEPNDEQLAYIQRTMDGIVDVLKSGDRSRIEAAVDIPSFAKYYLLNEFVKTVDFDYSSVYFYYKDGKLYAGPVWDYDLSMGNEDVTATSNYAAANKTEGLYCNTKHFYKWLCAHDWFFDAVYRIYHENSAWFDTVGADCGVIDSLYSANKNPIDRNFKEAKWGFTKYNLNRKPDSTYQANLTYLKTWCSRRAAWLKGYFTEDVTAYLTGDSNMSGEVDIMDATAIQRKLAEMNVLSYDAASADADGDSRVTVFDATVIQRYLGEIGSTPYVDLRQFRKTDQ